MDEGWPLEKPFLQCAERWEGVGCHYHAPHARDWRSTSLFKQLVTLVQADRMEATLHALTVAQSIGCLSTPTSEHITPNETDQEQGEVNEGDSLVRVRPWS